MDQYNNYYNAGVMENVPIAQNYNLNQEQYPQPGQYQPQQNGFLPAENHVEIYRHPFLSENTLEKSIHSK